MSNGKTRVQNVLMDAIVLAGKVSGATGGIITGIDASIHADLSNDQDLIQAQEHFTRALDVSNEVDREACIRQGLKALKEAMKKDFADTTKEQLKAAVLPFQESVDDHIEGMKGLMVKLSEVN